MLGSKVTVVSVASFSILSIPPVSIVMAMASLPSYVWVLLPYFMVRACGLGSFLGNLFSTYFDKLLIFKFLIFDS